MCDTMKCLVMITTRGVHPRYTQDTGVTRQMQDLHVMCMVDTKGTFSDTRSTGILRAESTCNTGILRAKHARYW